MTFIYFIILFFLSFYLLKFIKSRFIKSRFIKSRFVKLKFRKFQHKKIKTKDHKISYLEGGEGKTILFIHGFQGEKRYWLPYMSNLLSYHVLAFDLPAHGSSSYLKKDIHDLKYFIDVLRDFVNKKGLEKFYLMGTSLGGALACKYAYMFPHQVEKLILLNPIGIKRSEEELKEMVEKNKKYFFPENMKQFDDLYIYLMGSSSMKYYKKKFILNRLKRRRDIYEKIFSDVSKEEGIDDILEKIKSNTLLLFGKKDNVLGKKDYQIFLDKIPKNSLFFIENGHHVLKEDSFEKAIIYIKDFLRS